MPLQLYLIIRAWLSREEGQDVPEYAILVIFVGLFIIAGATGFGAQVKLIWEHIVAIARGLLGS